METGANPDAILYEPGHKEVYTFNGTGKSATVFDAATGAVKATIPLAGKPEFAVVDVNAGRIYNNIEDASTIVAIDTATHAVVNTWPIAPGQEASGLAIDLANHRLFAVCSNSLMVMLDSVSGNVLGTLPIGPGVDAAAYDPGTGYVFASSSDSTMTVAKVDGRQSGARPEAGYAGPQPDDDARPGHAPGVCRGGGVQAGPGGRRRQARAADGGPGVVQGYGVRTREVTRAARGNSSVDWRSRPSPGASRW